MRATNRQDEGHYNKSSVIEQSVLDLEHRDTRFYIQLPFISTIILVTVIIINIIHTLRRIDQFIYNH